MAYASLAFAAASFRSGEPMELIEGAGLGRAPGDIRIEVVVQVGAEKLFRDIEAEREQDDEQ